MNPRRADFQSFFRGFEGFINQSLTALADPLPRLTKAQSWHTQSELVTQAELMAKMHPVRVARTLPIILSREEVSRLIRQGSRYRTANGLVSSVEPMTPETGMMYLRLSIRGRVVHWSLFQN